MVIMNILKIYLNKSINLFNIYFINISFFFNYAWFLISIYCAQL